MRTWCASLLVLCVLAGVLAAPAPAAEGEETPGPFLKTKYGISLYGYLKFDMAYDDSRVSVGNYARWVEPELLNPDDSQFSATANQTRLGLLFDTEDRHKVRTRGRVEIDFYGDAPAENKPAILLRHAYLELEWAEAQAKLLAGQTSDIIAPLVPPTVNYTVWWWTGNIGYRRPQLRYTQGFGDDVGYRSSLALGIARNIGHDDSFEDIDTGQDEGRPVYQARYALAGPMAAGRTGSVGISGHYGKEEYDLGPDGTYTNLESWSLNLDLILPLAEWITFKGEYFVGKNLDAYLGGIGQGVTVPAAGRDPYEIGADGGWFTLSINPNKKLDVNFGGGQDDPDDTDLEVGDRSKNRAFFGNVWWNITPATKLGFELSHWDTHYLASHKADAMRFQTGFVYNF